MRVPGVCYARDGDQESLDIVLLIPICLNMIVFRNYYEYVTISRRKSRRAFRRLEKRWYE